MEMSTDKVCALCNAPSKYCCPGCSVRTCSLNCVKAHKAETGCNGVRDKTAFVKKQDFQNCHLLSDYRFLEDAARAIDNAGRAKKNQGFAHRLPQNLYKLKIAAKFRKTDLQILPIMFSKRKNNSTYLRYEDRVIFWKIEWLFPEVGLSYVDDRINEEMTINACLDKYLTPEFSESDVQQKLMYYQSVGHKGVSILMKKEDDPANIVRYHELNKNQSWKKNFQGKRIIENPVLFVVMKNHVYCYPLVEEVDEEHSEMKQKEDIACYEVC